MAGDLSQFECAAYHAILRALALSPASWETEEFLTSLRLVLHISDEVHMDYRSQVSADPDIAELRELQRSQGIVGMQPSLSAQRSMPVNPAPMGQPMMPPIAMAGSGAGMAAPLAGQPSGGLMPQQSLSGAGTRSQFGAPPAGGLGAPMQSIAASAAGTSTGTGRAGAGQRRATTGGAVGGRTTTAAGGAAAAGKGGGGKKGLAPSKAKQNSRFQTAVPHGVDIMEHDLRGYVIERRQDDMASWQQAVVAACKREATAQRLTLVYNLGTPEESFEHDVYLRKGKADVLWRFARPARQLPDDWDAVIARDPGHGGGGGGGGRASAPAGGAPAAKKRKSDKGRKAGAPYSKEAMQRAIGASMTTRRVDELKAMVKSIEETRRGVVGQLALERVRDMLSSMSVSSAKEQLNRELNAVRRKRAALESNGCDVATGAAGGADGNTNAKSNAAAAAATPGTGAGGSGAAAAQHAPQAGVAAVQAEGAADGDAPSPVAEQERAEAATGAAVGLANGAANGVQPMEQDEETDVD
eukprot:jgi/Ulvmu1/8134/UM040_0030.1